MRHAKVVGSERHRRLNEAGERKSTGNKEKDHVEKVRTGSGVREATTSSVCGQRVKRTAGSKHQ